MRQALWNAEQAVINAHRDGTISAIEDAYSKKEFVKKAIDFVAQAERHRAKAKGLRIESDSPAMDADKRDALRHEASVEDMAAVECVLTANQILGLR